MFRTVGERVGLNSATRAGRRRSRKTTWSLTGFLAAPPVESSAPQTRSQTGKRIGHLKIDVPLLLVVITLLIFGTLIVYSASYDYSLTWYGDPNTIFNRQLVFLV